MRHLVSSDIPDIALGSSLLGAGGGGDPYVGGLIARQRRTLRCRRSAG